MFRATRASPVQRGNSAGAASSAPGARGGGTDRGSGSLAASAETVRAANSPQVTVATAATSQVRRTQPTMRG